MSAASISAVILRAIVLIRSDSIYGPRLLNSWLPAETWLEVIIKMGHIDANITFTTRHFNTALSKSPLYGPAMSRFDGSNTTGIFRVTFQHRHFYYLTLETKQAVYPSPLNKAWSEKVQEVAANVLIIPSTRARPATVDSVTVLLATSNQESANGEEREEQSDSKRQRMESLRVSLSYWPSSHEACQLFLPNSRNGTSDSADESDSDSSCIETAQEALERRIVKLQAVHDTEDSWRSIVKGGDPDNYCTKTEVFEIRQRATFLCVAYKLALKHMSGWTWYDCCKEACKILNDIGFKQATFHRTVAEWNIIYRKLECFPHPNAYVQCGKRPLPRLLEIYPQAKDQIVSFSINKLATLTIEAVHDLIVSTIIPNLANQWEKETNDDADEVPIEDQQHLQDIDTSIEYTTNTSNANAPQQRSQEQQDSLIQAFLRAHGLQCMSLSTTYRWLRMLGFDRDSRKKSFYVDGHERKDVVDSRVVFCERYLTTLEPYCRRWVQYPISKCLAIQGLDVKFGYSYFDIVRNEEVIEFHVDYWNRHGKQGAAGQEPGIQPTTSIRVSAMARPIMIVGQDESVFAQYLLGGKTWIGPNGQRPLLPKSEGDGYMLSAFVSREFGFGRTLTEQELARVNEKRRANGATYIDTQAAMEIQGTIYKKQLSESPFVKYLFIGANNEGYWNSFHMSLQLEDVVDCLKVLYPEFDLVFLFDHSQGHARQRENALSALYMSKSYGGAQPVMRETVMMTEEGYLGRHLPELRVADSQSMVFRADDIGPWYLSPTQQALQRHDRPTGKTKSVEKSKKELLDALKERGVVLQQQRGYTKKELQDFARHNGIDLCEIKEVIKPGWEGKPKGLLQVLGERGLIDRGMLDKYTVNGRKHPVTGAMDLQYSLRHIMGSCKDFQEEETALQFLGTQLGVSVLLTPKFHAELAGEGVEYSWAHSKSYYRRMPLSRKRGRENFKQLVRESTCPVNVLPKERIEKFASRARAYICTYHHLDQQQRKIQAALDAGSDQNTDDSTPSVVKQELLFKEIESLSKDLKCHRAVIDFDSAFVNAELRYAQITGN